MHGRRLNRRGFFRAAGVSTAGAVLFPYLIPGSALGADGATAPSVRIAMGGIGLGGMGQGDLCISYSQMTTIVGIP